MAAPGGPGYARGFWRGRCDGERPRSSMRAIDQGAKAPPPAGAARQAPFARVAPLIAAALVIGVVGGFALAAMLTVTRMLGVTGLWWAAAAQAHGHLQLYGWAG